MADSSNVFNFIIRKTLIMFLACVVGLSVGAFLALNGNVAHFFGALSFGTGAISSTGTNHYAYSENLGWIDFNPTYSGGSVVLGFTGLTGYAWSENAGWISLSSSGFDGAPAASQTSTDWGVVNDGTGNLSGYAYGENIGWISFSCSNTSSCGSNPYGVKVDGNGNFSGYAWGENAGWISFNCSNDNDSCNPAYEVQASGEYYNQVPTTLTIQTQPDTACGSLSVQPVVLVIDQHGANMASGTVTATVATGTGSLTGNTVTISNGAAAFTSLAYSKNGESFSIKFTDGSAAATSNAIILSTTPCGGGGGAGGGGGYTPPAPAPVITPTPAPAATPAPVVIPPSSAPAPIVTPTPSPAPGATPAPVSESQSAQQSSVADYVTQELQQIKPFVPQSVPAFTQPTSQPPSNLQPTQPPPAENPTAASNQQAIIQVIQQILDALRSMLNIVS